MGCTSWKKTRKIEEDVLAACDEVHLESIVVRPKHHDALQDMFSPDKHIFNFLFPPVEHEARQGKAMSTHDLISLKEKYHVFTPLENNDTHDRPMGNEPTSKSVPEITLRSIYHHDTKGRDHE